MLGFYKIDPKSEKELRHTIENNPSILDDIRARIAKLREIPEGRCVVSDVQREYLERILGSYSQQGAA